MARIDRFLEQMISRGASVLRLDPGGLPVAELPGGIRVNLSAVDLVGAVLDGVVKEILPEEEQLAFLRGEKVTFDYALDGVGFQILCCRTPKGSRLVVGRYHGARSGLTGAPSLASLNELVYKLVTDGGSDLYLHADDVPLARVGGALQAWSDFGALAAPRLEELVRAWVPPRVWEDFTAGQDTVFSHNDAALPGRLRITLAHDHPALSVAVRVIPREGPDADTLGFPAPVRRLAMLNKGLVLLTGPMGSGKSTTLSCLLGLAATWRKGYLITIQDAVEYELPKAGCLVRQREVGGDPVRHRQAIQTALREAPDILCVGEIRDGGILELALQAVQTGRMVVGTLATVSLLDTLHSLVDMAPLERRAHLLSRLAESLKAILGHTLLPRIGGGQVVALETHFMTPASAALIRENRMNQLPGALKQGQYGQVSHNDALIALIRSGKVEAMDAYLRCQDRESFITACIKAEIPFDPRNGGTVTEV